MPKLVAITEDFAGKVYDLNAPNINVGRGPDNHIRIEDGTISTHHAVFIVNGDSVILRDLNSTNGTRVNGQKITETKLLHGDMVKLGRIDMRFESEVKRSAVKMPERSAGVKLEQNKPTEHLSAVNKPKGFQPKQNSGKKIFLIIVSVLLILVLVLLLYVFSKLKSKDAKQASTYLPVLQVEAIHDERS